MDERGGQPTRKYPSDGSFYGRLVNKRMVADLSLWEAYYDRAIRIPKHEHEDAFFCLVLSGYYDEKYGTRSRSCSAGMLTFQSEQESHEVKYPRQGARIFNIDLGSEWRHRLKHYSVRLGVTSDYHSGIRNDIALRILKEFRTTDEMSSLAIEGLTLEMIAQTSRESNVTNAAGSKWIQTVRDYLHDNCRQRITLAKLAETIDIHPVHLAREFRRCHQVTIGEYLRRLRIEMACREISETNNSFVEIALNCGFADQAHFSKTFKRMTSLTPTDYRLMSRANHGQKFKSFNSNITGR